VDIVSESYSYGWGLCNPSWQMLSVISTLGRISLSMGWGIVFGSGCVFFFGFLFALYLQHLEAISLHFAWYLHKFVAKNCQITQGFTMFFSGS
jgi:hypothetical protein